jgi:hypothetical protein
VGDLKFPNKATCSWQKERDTQVSQRGGESEATQARGQFKFSSKHTPSKNRASQAGGETRATQAGGRFGILESIRDVRGCGFVDTGISEKSVLKRNCGSVDIGAVEKTALKHITIDSGAGVSVWPAHWRCPGQAVQGQRMRLEAANGTEIQQYGRKKIAFEINDTKRPCAMDFVVTDVTKPLAAVSAIVEAGNTVVFSKAGSYIENTASGERIRLKCEKGGRVHDGRGHQAFGGESSGAGS